MHGLDRLIKQLFSSLATVLLAAIPTKLTFSLFCEFLSYLTPTQTESCFLENCFACFANDYDIDVLTFHSSSTKLLHTGVYMIYCFFSE